MHLDFGYKLLDFDENFISQRGEFFNYFYSSRLRET